MLHNKNLIQRSEMYMNEKIPAVISQSSELIKLYESTDLRMGYAAIKIKELEPLKMVTISDLTIKAWFVEFIKNGWTKEIFDNRLEAVKRAKLFGGVIDYQMWIDSEIKYADFEVEILIRQRIQKYISRGHRIKRILEAGVQLSEEEKQYCELANTQELENNMLLEKSLINKEV